MSAYVYILTNRKHGALYTGVTSDVPARMMHNRGGSGSKFCADYGIDRLVHVEEFATILDAIAREKAVKKWRDLFYVLNGGAEGKAGDGSPLSHGLR